MHGGKRLFGAFFRLNLDRGMRLENIEILPVVYLWLVDRKGRFAVSVHTRPTEVFGSLGGFRGSFRELTWLCARRLAEKKAR